MLNGTCNYNRRLWGREGASFADSLTAARAEGYAEADPSFDVDGIHAAHKLSILAALCFGSKLDIDTVATTGIRNLIAADIREAVALGHRGRLTGMAAREATGLCHQLQPSTVRGDYPRAYLPGRRYAVRAGRDLRLSL